MHALPYRSGSLARAATILAVAWTLLAAVPAAAQEALALDCADRHYQITLQRLAALANQALPLIQAAERLNEKAEVPDVPLNEQLPPQDLKEFERISKDLHALYAMNFAESSFARDLELISGLFQASRLLHAERTAYVKRNATDRGFDDYLASQVKMDRESYFYLEILLYLQNLVPTDMEMDFSRLPDAETETPR